jgi:hypothetical protein
LPKGLYDDDEIESFFSIMKAFFSAKSTGDRLCGIWDQIVHM